jgi:hypothetical protein
MKHLLLFITLLFSSLLFSQPSISRAHEVCFGTRETISENFVWSDNIQCNFLIVASDQTITVHAKKKFEYYTIEDLGENEDRTTHKFLMLDQDGKKCHLFVTRFEDIVCIIVEYADTGIIYFTKAASEN